MSPDSDKTASDEPGAVQNGRNEAFAAILSLKADDSGLRPPHTSQSKYINEFWMNTSIPTPAICQSKNKTRSP